MRGEGRAAHERSQSGLSGPMDSEAKENPSDHEPVEWARLNAVVHGRVQGVNFRAHTRRRALSLDLRGYVRNSWDGTVEVVAEGPRKAVESLLDFLRGGPPSAWVERVDFNWEVTTGEFWSFEVRY